MLLGTTIANRAFYSCSPSIVSCCVRFFACDGNFTDNLRSNVQVSILITRKVPSGNISRTAEKRNGENRCVEENPYQLSVRELGTEYNWIRNLLGNKLKQLQNLNSNGWISNSISFKFTSFLISMRSCKRVLDFQPSHFAFTQSNLNKLVSNSSIHQFG